ncbi:hypothetical protein [Paraburkholderia aspalathi]|uniref:hypothetical protein n=1 Tax=Paraburkholderia aspalathi TaxID=1324617 RepID=UPI001BAAE158|nr:hypothetical protein [Paraburkholderia aspalathi]
MFDRWGFSDGGTGRQRLTWTDAQVHTLLAALPGFDRDFPQDNAAFLDTLIAELRLIAGRIYGATTYDTILRTFAPKAGIVRRPSSATIQQAGCTRTRPGTCFSRFVEYGRQGRRLRCGAARARRGTYAPDAGLSA